MKDRICKIMKNQRLRSLFCNKIKGTRSKNMTKI